MENSELKNRKTEAVDAIIAWLDEKHIMSETDTGNTQIDKRVECVVLSGDGRSGISCDWANATKETDE